MKIFDAHISGSLSVSSSAQIEGDLTVLGTVNATISGTTTNALTASEAPRYTLTSSFHTFTSSYTTASSSFNTRVGNLESFSSSLDSNFVSETEFGSHTGSVNSFTSSASGRLSSIETSTGSLNTFTSSTNGRLTSIETSTGALNSFTSSIDTTIKNKLNTEGVISGSIQVTISSTTGYSTFSSSIATTTSNIENRAGSLETSTSSLNTFTSSAAGRLTAIETSTSSLNSYSSSNTTNINAIHTATSSLNSYTSSTNTRLGVIEISTGALNTFTSSASGRLSSIETSTSSLNSYTSSNNTTLGTLQTATGALNTFSSSTNTRLNAIETSTSSLNTFTSSIDTTIKNKLNTEGVISGSVQVTISNTTGYSTFSSSIATTDSTQDGRLTSLEGKTGSYATTGSNVFIGNQTITGSLYITQDLVIGGSSSIQHITSSQLNIGDNIITVNAQNPSIRFGGLSVIDSGSSPQVSGSILFDSINNQWVFVHQNQGTVTSSVLMMGPETYNNLGGEGYLTQNRLPKGSGIEHLTDSNITDTGTKVSINSNTEVTGSIKSTSDITAATNLVSNFSSGDEGGEINLNKPVTNTTLSSGITIDVWRDRVRIFESGGTNRGGFFNIAGLSTGAGTNFQANADTASFVEYSNVANKPALVSGSSQVSFSGLSGVPSGIVSGSSQVLAGTTIHSGTFFNGISVVSGSAQIDHNSTTNYVANQHTDHTSVSISAGNGLSGGGDISTTRTLTLDTGSVHFTGGVKTKMNTDGVVSSSAQIVAALPSGTVSGSSQVLNGTGIWSGSAQLPAGVVSGSSQVSFSGLSGVPAGLVSGSSQITYGSISGIPSGIVSGSSQISFGSISGVPSGLVSGSSQITFGSITGVPSGLVSGSSQVLNGSGVWSGSAQLPSGVVSGSSQITFGSISGIPSGLVSGSSQIAFGSISGVPSGLVSGSSQIAFGSITGVPSGLVSGSSQVAIASTSGFGTYINQAVLTTSAPTFDYVLTSNNGNGTNIRLGDDAWFGDVNLANTTRLMGVQNNANGYIIFGNGDNTALGRASTGALTYGGNTVWHAGNDGASSGLDADLLDGSHASAFSPVAGSSSITTVGTISSGTWNGSSISTTYTDAKVTSVSAGTGISVNATTGAVTVTNSGVTSIAGTSNQITASASTGGVTLSLPQNIHTSASPTFNRITTSGLYGNSGNGNIPIWQYDGSNTGYGIVYNEASPDTLRIDVSGQALTGTPDVLIGPDYIQVNGNTVYHAGNIPTWNQNTTGTASNITSYTINQNLGTGNSPSFAALTAPAYNVTAGEGYGVYFWQDSTNYTIKMGSTASVYQYGPVTDYSMRFTMGSGTGRGFTWGYAGNSPIAALNAYSGNMQIAGVFTEMSSIRYKKDIEVIPYGLEKILSMRGVTYVKKENNVKEVGVIAEEIAEILPDLVLYDSEGKPDSVSYGRITAVLIEAIKDLKKEIEELKGNI